MTHYDWDHIGLIPKAFRWIHFSEIFLPHFQPHSKKGSNFLNWLKKRAMKLTSLTRGSRFQFGELEIKILHAPDKQVFRNENKNSLAILGKLPNKSFLLTGDLPQKMENSLSLSSIDILKVGHHGSKTSTSRQLLKEATPKTCIVSAGKNNRYGHPHKGVMRKLTDAHCATLDLSRTGHLIF